MQSRTECCQAAMMSLAYKEGVSFPPAALNKVIVAANQDVRQVTQHCHTVRYGAEQLVN